MVAIEPVPDGEEEDITIGQDLFYVSEKALAGIKEKLSNGKKEEDIKPILAKVLDPELVPDEEMMVPVDMRGVGKEFDSIEDMVAELGVVGTAEAIVKAREYFEANKDEEPEDERPKPMTASEWKRTLEEDEEGEESLDLEGEDEEELMGEEEEEEDDDEEAEEPPAKKAKN
mmetsp:Transcript_99521/g.267306  ORF Transcript_99521/g.267306 Transcript_99521/m.267306 type:complete len:172 (+) Transcript_99521:78-593(+)